MSIVSTWTNNIPMLLRGMADSQSATVVSALMETPGYEVCVCDGCDFSEVAFVKSDGDWWQNDWKSFIYSKRFSSDTITFSLLKDGVQQAVLNNNSYGTYYNFGSATLINPNYKGFVIDWNLVQQGFGYGSYVVRTVHTSLGTDYTYDSHPFEVVEYNAYRADGTVRLEWYQSGSIMSGFDYTGIGWGQAIRIDGKFGNKTPELIIDNYQDTNRNVKQIQSKIDNTYTLNTHLLPSYIYDVINEDAILANDIYVTDYNLKNTHVFRRFNIYAHNIKDVRNHALSKRSNFVYEFKAKRDNTIKRNIDGDWALLPTQQSSTKVVEIKALNLVFSFDAGESETTLITIDADSEGSFTAQSQDGSSGTITFDKNGGGYGAFVSPLNLSAGDTLQVKRTSTGSDGYVKITGTYV